MKYFYQRLSLHGGNLRTLILGECDAKWFPGWDLSKCFYGKPSISLLLVLPLNVSLPVSSFILESRTNLCPDISPFIVFRNPDRDLTLNGDLSGCENTRTENCQSLQHYKRRIVRLCKFYERRNVRTEFCPDPLILLPHLSSLSHVLGQYCGFQCVFYVTRRRTGEYGLHGQLLIHKYAFSIVI